MGYMGLSKEIPVEWDILVSVSDRFLKEIMRRDDLTRLELPARWTWYLDSYPRGPASVYGTVEISKIRPGASRVVFSGLPSFVPSLDDEYRKGTEQHFQYITGSYFSRVENELQHIQGHELQAGTAKPDDNILPSLNQDRLEKVKELASTLSNKQLAERLAVSESTIKRDLKKLRLKRRRQ